MRYFVSLVVFHLILISCASTSINQTIRTPPTLSSSLPSFPEKTDTLSLELFFRQMAQEHSKDPATQWWATYNLGLLWTDRNNSEACTHFSKLAGENEFPLRKMAELRRLEVCQIPDHELTPLLDRTLTKDTRWLDDLALEIALKRARQLGQKEYLVRLLLEYSQHQRFQTEKLEALKEARDVANSLHFVDEVKSIDEQIAKIAPRFIEIPKDDELFSIATDHRKARNFEKARSFFNKIVSLKHVTEEKRFSALQGIRSTYKLEHNDDEFLRLTTEIRERARKSFLRNKRSSTLAKRYFDASISGIRALWTHNRIQDTDSLFKLTEKDLKGRASLAELEWLRARMEEERGNFEKAIALGDSAYGQLKQNPNLKEKILWLKAWNLRKLKKYTESNDFYEQLIAMREASMDRSRYMYWKGRNLKDSGLASAANEVFHSVILEDPMGYYGILASRELGEKFKPLQAPVEPTYRRTDLRRGTFDWLLALGENDLARRYLDSNQTNQKSEDPTEVMLSYARAGHFAGVFARLGNLTQEKRMQFLSDHPDLVFPQAYLPLVRDSARRFGVNPNLIYGIIRQESAFDTRARSPADAFGLMQLLPETAEKMESTTQIHLRDHEDLYKPNVNIPLGAAYLRKLWDQYNGQFILVAASYNASEDAVKNWVQTRFRDDPTEFVEDIPYEETRTYVRLVLRNMLFYMRLSATFPLPFPEWCLEGLQDFKS